MALYYLFSAKRKTLVLSSPSEMSPEKMNLCREYNLIGETAISPFEFTTSNGTLRFNFRFHFSQVIEQKKEKIYRQIDELCEETGSIGNRKDISENIYGRIPIRGNLHVFQYNLFDFMNLQSVTTKLLFLQTEFDNPLPEQIDELDIPLWIHSIALFGKNPKPEKWMIEKIPIGKLSCMLRERPISLELITREFFDSEMREVLPF